MRSLSSLVHSACSRQREFTTMPTATIVVPARTSLHGLFFSDAAGAFWCGYTLFSYLYWILLPLLAPVYYIFANWYCHKYDAEFTKADPKGWPKEKSQILRNHRNILLGWIIFIVWGYCVDWGQNDLPYEYTQPSTHWKESKWGPNPDGSFDEYYKSISEDNPK